MNLDYQVSFSQHNLEPYNELYRYDLRDALILKDLYPLYLHTQLREVHVQH